MTTTNHTSGEELLPCPFCGGSAQYEFDDTQIAPYGHYHTCNRCATTTGSYPSKSGAIEGWNRRAEASDKSIGEDAANGVTLPAWFDTFLTNVCEIPDRNSPDDEPEAMIATAEELRNCAINAIEHFECQRSALTDPLQGWSVYVERNGEHFLTISNNHVAGAEITDELAALVRTAAAHLLSFVGNGPDHAGGYVGLSAEKTLSANGAIGEREADEATTVYDPVHVREKFSDYQRQIDGLTEELAFARAALTAEKVAAVGYVNSEWAKYRRGTATIYPEAHPRIATSPLYADPQPAQTQVALTEPAYSWLPISSAPRDGSNILIRFGRDGVSQAKYVPGVPHPWKFIDTNDGITWLINGARDDEYGPSHWMPMPSPCAPEPGDVTAAQPVSGGK